MTRATNPSLIVNFWPLGRGLGYVASLKSALYKYLNETSVELHGLDGMSSAQQVKAFVAAVDEVSPENVYFIGSPTRLGSSSDARKLLLSSLKGKSLTYWDSDGWGRGKPVTAAMKFWARRANFLFHSGGFENVERISGPNTQVIYCPQTFCHVNFAQACKTPPPLSQSNRILFLGNNVTKTRIPIPGLTGISGGFERFLLALRAKSALADRLDIAGWGWPTSWATSQVDFAVQTFEIRHRFALLTWDHFSHRRGYYSDRLPASLLAGRIHISNCHVGIREIELNSPAYFPISAPHDFVNQLDVLAQEYPRNIHQKEMQTWEWARQNLGSEHFGDFIVEQSRLTHKLDWVSPFWAKTSNGVISSFVSQNGRE